MITASSTPRTWRIYALRDPRDLRIRYVGVTRNSLRWRLTLHLQDNCGVRRAMWIRQLRRARKTPTIELLAEFDGTELDASVAEKAWMDLLEAKFGADLLNVHRKPPCTCGARRSNHG